MNSIDNIACKNSITTIKGVQMAAARKSPSGRIISIIDTNVFIGAADAPFRKSHNRDIVIPMVVLQELENHRSDVGSGWACRTVLHYIEYLREKVGGDVLANKGADIENGCTVRIETDHLDTSILGDLDDGKNDAKILAVAANLKEETGQEVEVISNDLPMRLKADLGLGLKASEYGNSTIKPFTGMYEYNPLKPIDDIDDDEINDYIEGVVKEQGGTVPYRVVVHIVDSDNMEKWLMKVGDRFEELDSQITISRSIRPKNLEQEIAFTYLNDEGIQVVTLGGVAGAGKSFMALAEGMKEVDAGHFNKVIVFRSMYELGQQKMGFLPGDIDDKISPWSQAVWDNVSKLDRMNSGKKGAADMESTKKRHVDDIEVSPISYLRGRTLDDAFIIVDDAQSLDRTTLLDILARLGKNTRIILTFDILQNDNPYISESTSILQLINDFRDKKVFAHIDFTKSERSELAQLASNLLGR